MDHNLNSSKPSKRFPLWIPFAYFYRSSGACKLKKISKKNHSYIFNIYKNQIRVLKRGDLEAIERVAYELCEMQAKEGAIYSEVHYPPHYLLPEKFHSPTPSNVQSRTGRILKSSLGLNKKLTPWLAAQGNRLASWKANQANNQTTPIKREMSIRDVVDAVNRGLARGQREYKVTVRSVLTLIRTKPEWSADIVNVAIETKQDGVVGIDMIGDVFGVTSAPNELTTQNGE